MASDPDQPFTLVFIGHAEPALEARAAAYEDRVLPLLADHGARLLFGGGAARTTPRSRSRCT